MHTLCSLHNQHNERHRCFVICDTCDSLSLSLERRCATLAMLVTFLTGCMESPAAVRVPGEKWRAPSPHTHTQHAHTHSNIAFELKQRCFKHQPITAVEAALTRAAAMGRLAQAPPKSRSQEVSFSGWIKTSCLNSHCEPFYSLFRSIEIWGLCHGYKNLNIT